VVKRRARRNHGGAVLRRRPTHGTPDGTLLGDVPPAPGGVICRRSCCRPGSSSLHQSASVRATCRRWRWGAAATATRSVISSGARTEEGADQNDATHTRTLSPVGVTATVRMMSAATRIRGREEWSGRAGAGRSRRRAPSSRRFFASVMKTRVSAACDYGDADGIDPGADCLDDSTSDPASSCHPTPQLLRDDTPVAARLSVAGSHTLKAPTLRRRTIRR